jgi:hypothetical protein
MRSFAFTSIVALIPVAYARYNPLHAQLTAIDTDPLPEQLYEVSTLRL